MGRVCLPPFISGGYILEVVTRLHLEHHSHLQTLRRTYTNVSGRFYRIAQTKSRLSAMRSLLKLAVILFCIQKGEAHWLRSLISKWQLQWGGHDLLLPDFPLMRCVLFSRSETGNALVAGWGQRKRFSWRQQNRGIRDDLCSHRSNPSPNSTLVSRLSLWPALHPAAGSRPGIRVRLRRERLV